MWMHPINADEFLEAVRPALDQGSAAVLAECVQARWTPEQVSMLLHHDRVSVRRVACVVLGLVGDGRAVPVLAGALHDFDTQVHAMAENALWSIWFRMGSDESQPLFKRGLDAVNNDQPDEAVRLFRASHNIDPTFAEACHQSALAHFELGQYVDGIVDCRNALQLIPVHFGAWACLGNCHAHIGNLAEGARYYRKALRINPHMNTIAESLAQITRCVSGIEAAGVSGVSGVSGV